VCFPPSESAAQQLAGEGVVRGVHVVGDLMVDLAVRTARSLPKRSSVLERLGVEPGRYAVATVHRASNTDDPAAFERIVAGLRRIGMRVVFPVHPRTRALAQRFELGADGDSIEPCDPLPYVAMIGLVAGARLVLTDSGGLQKEAVALGVPCVTLRDETEWTATVECGWNALAGTDPDRIAELARRPIPTVPPSFDHPVGNSAETMARILNDSFKGAMVTVPG